MTYSIVCGVLASIGAIGILALVTGQVDRIGRVPDRKESHGSFVIVTHTRSDEHYSVLYRGKPFPIEGRAGMFGDATATYSYLNAVMTWDEDGSSFIVHVGDPNNTGFFYLVHEVAGGARADYLCDTSGGVAADLLDGPPDSRAGVRALTLHRGRFSGGRWLLLGDHCVFDTQELKTHQLQPVPSVYLTQFKPPLALSPDQRSFVRLASGSEDAQFLVVYRIFDGSSYTLSIDQQTMHWVGWEDMAPGWLEHHFEWRRDDSGFDQLAQRAHWTPLP